MRRSRRRQGRRRGATVLHEAFFTGTTAGMLLTPGEFGMIGVRPFRIVSASGTFSINTNAGTAVAVSLAFNVGDQYSGYWTSRSILAAHGAVTRFSARNPNQVWNSVVDSTRPVIAVEIAGQATHATLTGIIRINVSYGPPTVAGTST